MSAPMLSNTVRMSPLAHCLALALALGPACSSAATSHYGLGGYNQRAATAPPMAAVSRPLVSIVPVTNCKDDGSAGTLRSVVMGATSGETVDLSHLTCSTISLANGAIATSVDSLHFLGPGSAKLQLNANQSYRRIISHTGIGTLTISGLTLIGGWAGIGSAAYGGCVFSAGSVVLDHAAVVYCKAVSLSTPARGGGIYASKNLELHHSIVSGNETNPGTNGAGGGAFSAGDLGVYYSTITDNYSLNLGSGGGFGGGLFTLGNVNIVASTIARNHAVNVGGVSIAGYAASAVIVNSTITDNVASKFIAGVYSNSPLHVYNSTIAFNSAAETSSTFVSAGGLQVYGTSVDLQSTIVANNTAASLPFDVGEQAGSITGTNNLIRTSSDLLPADTITEDPQLQALQYNGGETATRALAGTSPAIDYGNIVNPLNYDQRGPGYPRVVGAAPDIGAFEFRDLIFRNGFDGM